MSHDYQLDLDGAAVPISGGRVLLVRNPYEKLALPYRVDGHEFLLAALLNNTPQSKPLFFCHYGNSEQYWSHVFEQAKRWADKRLAHEYQIFLRSTNAPGGFPAEARLVISQVPARSNRVIIPVKPDPYFRDPKWQFSYAGISNGDKLVNLDLKPRRHSPGFSNRYSGASDPDLVPQGDARAFDIEFGQDGTGEGLAQNPNPTIG